MAAEPTMLQTPERAANALTAQSPASSSPAPSDDDTISESSFDAGSDHFAFTPKRLAKLPRAWERKPSTPFAPRTETQKIWKRVPLQDKNTNNTVEIRANGKDGADSRGVKRVRLTTRGAGNGKENYANTQWDEQSDNAKRKVPKEQKNALQSTRNSLSPLRKDCTFEILNDPSHPTALELEADRVISRLEEMQRAEGASMSWTSSEKGSPDTIALKEELLRSEEPEEPLQPLQSEREEHPMPQTPTSENSKAELAADIRDANSEDGAATTPSANEFFTDSVIFDDQNSESEVDEDPIAEEALQIIQNSDAGSEVPMEQANYMNPPADASTIRSLEDEGVREVSHASSESPLAGFEQHYLPRQVTNSETIASETESTYPIQTESNRKPEIVDDVLPVLQGYETIPDLMDTAEDLTDQIQDSISVSPLSEQKETEANIIDSESYNGQTETLFESKTGLSDKETTLEAVTDPQAPPEAISDSPATTDSMQSDILIFCKTSDSLSSKLFTPQAPTLSAPEAPPSDDTAYLHDFLTRARAQKAARAVTSPEKMDHNASSPAKKTRQALANLSKNPMSPSKPAQTELNPNETVDDDMKDEQAMSPCRRSGRPRIPKPLKSVVPAIPNTIPVRRSNGTEFVFLQRTEAMQIALATRNNTKRNKGEALPPSARLETLTAGELSPIKERKKSSKVKKLVKWDEALSQEQLDAVLEDHAVLVEIKPETKPEPQIKVQEEAANEAEKSEKREKNARKSVKRLGTVNGTPAPKKVMAATALPVPTRTLRARTKT